MRGDAPSKPAVLMVVDQLPYPPRNGVTLPTFHYADGLRQSCALSLALLADEAQPVDTQALAENEAIFGKIPVIGIRRRHKVRRAVDEILARDMFNQGWELAGASSELLSGKADVLLASPFSAAAKWAAAGLDAPRKFRCRIAAVSDCTAAEYYARQSQDFGSVRQAIKGALDRARSFRIATVEGRTLDNYQYVLMQTGTDRNLMRQLVGNQIADRVTLVPNGVRRDFFNVVRNPQSKTFVFIAELSSEYASIADWLVREVWPTVTAELADAKLLVVGRGASEALSAAIAHNPNVEHVTFVNDLRSIYTDAAAAICPVFKGYGLINKALEAMASGVPVIGGSAAFNGIDHFEAGVHGVVCRPRNTQDFASAICDVLKNREQATRIGIAGRSLIEGHFRWERAVGTIEALIAGMVCSDD